MSTKPDNSTPLALARTFLAGIKARDIATMKSLCVPGATATLIREGKPRSVSLQEVFERIGEVDSSVQMDEYSHDEVELIDDDFALVWTPYKFDENGKLHHTGTNTFNCWKSPEKGWLIMAVADVARRGPGVEKMSIITGEDLRALPE